MKLTLSLILLFSALDSFASGSNTVFRKVRDYYITEDIGEASGNRRLAETLERLDRPVLIVKVNQALYIEIATYLYMDFPVTISLEESQHIHLYWNEDLDAVIGESCDGNLFVLSF